jgi:hypothetical protein
MNYLINRCCQTTDENYYPVEEVLIERCAHIQRDNGNRNCSFQFPCFETRNVFKESGRIISNFTTVQGNFPNIHFSLRLGDTRYY